MRPTCSWQSGVPAAIAHFERAMIPEAGRALSRLRLSAPEVDETLQRIREKLLVRGESEPLIASYSGKGALIGWVRAVAVREALSEKRKVARQGTPVSESGLLDLAAREEPELTRMRALYAEPFKAAFRDALLALAPRDRNVLRMVYVDGLTAEQVGLAYGVHRVSVARWIGTIRTTLFERTRDTLATRLKVSHGELHSLTRMCLSQLDVSIERILGS
jgi:RNA polymerase sigma-70 factor (ECF subfamily)